MFSIKNLKNNNLIVIVLVVSFSLILTFLVMELDHKDQIITYYEEQQEYFIKEEELEEWDLTKHLYPFNINESITVTAGAAANEWGSWQNIVPENVINSDWKLVAFHICNISSDKDLYMIQFSYGDDREHTLGYDCFNSAGKTRGNDIPAFMDKTIDANDPLWVRMRTYDGGSETASIRIKYIKKN
jgi:hypothetical protein